ncbi:serine/threonine protein kinase [Calocera viscosa TUFC12733]|uniref:Serine/threonine protein kinase n=1 Tax=Calocera viscosa (strain TUFC12733) TaxID=1330018 RepID=A0A167NQU0_CALVF|nr:serine/threonine protein kinase [Calocera viscosa TUFC12733]
MKPPPLKRSTTAQPPTSSNGNTFSSRGQIHVKLIQARGLRVLSPHSKPYAVVQFEQNEFVGRDPIPETEREAKGIATNLSRNNSSTALGALGTLERAAGNLSLQPRTRKDTNSSNGSQRSGNGLGASLFGTSSPYNPVWKHEVSFDVTSDDSYISFNVYDRSVEPETFLGALELKPVLIHEHTVDQWHKLRARDASEQVSGEIRIQLRYEQHKTKRHLSPRDFEFMKLIGRGTFGRVFQVRKKDTRRIYAMKVLSKKEIVAKKEVAHTIGERKILQRSLECPFLVGLKFSFQTEADLYLVTDFKSGGELFWHLQKETRFTEERARFYIAELVLALEHLHKYNIVYRDLKPENILLDATGHVALCDFGLSKPDLPGDQLTNTFCGTTEYLAPEVLLDDHGYSKLVDFWSLGVLLFEMCCGWSPFYAEDTQQMYKNICFGKIRFPRGVISEEGKQFVKGLLNRNPKHRLGAMRDAAELKEHPFFLGIDWELLAAKKITPPFKPNVESDESTANFDPEFTSADLAEVGIDIYEDEDISDDWTRQGPTAQKTYNGPQGSQPKRPPMAISGQRNRQNPKEGSPLTSSVQDNFKGFTYTGDSILQNGASFLEGRDIHIQEDEAVSDEEVDKSEDELNEEVAAGRNSRRRVNDRMDVDP